MILVGWGQVHGHVGGASHLWLACAAPPCWRGNTSQNVQVNGVSGLQAPSDASVALVKRRDQFFAWVGLSHAGQAYSAVEKLRARAVARSVLGHAPHLVLVSLRRMLLRVLTLAFVFMMWVLNTICQV